MPSKTATGTIAIQVLDHNDHCPTLTTTRSTLCSDVKTVNVTGFDEDVSPNAAPFTFRIIPKGTRGSWDVEVINGKKMCYVVRVRRQKQIQPAFFPLAVVIVLIIFFLARAFHSEIDQGIKCLDYYSVKC